MPSTSQLEYSGSVYADEKNILEASVAPFDASNRFVKFSMKDPTTTGAVIEHDIELKVTNPGDVIITASITNADTGLIDFQKDIKFRAYGARIPVTAAQLTIDEWDPHPINGHATKLDVQILPASATERNYKITLKDPGPAQVSFNADTNEISSDPTIMTYEMGTVQATFEIRIPNGIAKGVDYVTNVKLRIKGATPPSLFVPITDMSLNLPTPLRALYPILINSSAELFPWNCSMKDVQFNTARDGEDSGCNCIIYNPNDYELVNDVLSDFFDWERAENYLFPWSKGRNILTARVINGDSINHDDIYCTETIDYEKQFPLTFEDPYIPVKNIINIPLQISARQEYALNVMELDTELGLKFYNPYWDDEVPTYTNLQWRLGSQYFNILEHPNEAGAVVRNGNIIYANRPGTFTIQAYVPNGTKEPIQWYDREQLGEPFTKLITITVVEEEIPFTDPIVTLTLVSGTVVRVYTYGDFSKLCTTNDADSNITIGNRTFKKSDVKEVKFWDVPEGASEDDLPNITCLWNFGRNFTNLTKIDRIPETVTGPNCLRNFLRGCTSFNQAIEIPAHVNGTGCLMYFLRDCTSFNKPVTFEATGDDAVITGDDCMHGFLYGCTAFNQPIEIPKSITGPGALERFLQGCSRFNQPVDIPAGLSGAWCLRNFLADCRAFNQPLTLPTDVGAFAYELNGMMFGCDSMVSDITVPADTGEHAMVNERSFASLHKTSDLITDGLHLKGAGADTLMGKIVNALEIPPYINVSVKHGATTGY